MTVMAETHRRSVGAHAKASRVSPLRRLNHTISAQRAPIRCSGRPHLADDTPPWTAQLSPFYVQSPHYPPHLMICSAQLTAVCALIVPFHTHPSALTVPLFQFRGTPCLSVAGLVPMWETGWLALQPRGNTVVCRRYREAGFPGCAEVKGGTDDSIGCVITIQEERRRLRLVSSGDVDDQMQSEMRIPVFTATVGTAKKFDVKLLKDITREVTCFHPSYPVVTDSNPPRLYRSCGCPPGHACVWGRGGGVLSGPGPPTWTADGSRGWPGGGYLWGGEGRLHTGDVLCTSGADAMCRRICRSVGRSFAPSPGTTAATSVR